MGKPRKPDPRIRHQRLPGLLGQIEDLLGYRVAERFAVAFGGTELYIPLQCPEEHPIAKAVGWKAARAICAEFGRGGPLPGGGWIVPTGEVELKWNVARRLRLEGHSRNAIVAYLRNKYRLATTTKRVSSAISDLPVPSSRPVEQRRPTARPGQMPQDPTLWEWARVHSPPLPPDQA